MCIIPQSDDDPNRFYVSSKIQKDMRFENEFINGEPIHSIGKGRFPLEFNRLLIVLQEGRCQYCGKRLHYDYQEDSIYVNCLENTCGKRYFEGFRDLESGEIIFYYYANGDRGYMQERELSRLNEVLLKRSLHTSLR